MSNITVGGQLLFSGVALTGALTLLFGAIMFVILCFLLGLSVWYLHKTWKAQKTLKSAENETPTN